jgi:ABC-2 type transport system permease protein
MREFGILLRKELRGVFWGSYGPLAMLFFCVSFSVYFFAGFASSAQGYFRNLILAIPAIAIFVIPVITMGVWSDEEKQGTKKILLSFPVPGATLVAAKFVSRIIVFLAAILLCFPVLLMKGVAPEPGIFFASMVMVFLFGVLSISFGQFLSGLFSGPVTAFIVTTAGMLALNTIHLVPLLVALPQPLQFLFTRLSFAWHLESASRGILDTQDVFFYLVPAAFFLYLDAVNLSRGRTRA